MRFDAAIKTTPLPFDPDKGSAALEKVAATGAFADLIKGAAGSSPYLSNLITRNGAFVGELASRDAKEVFAELLDAPGTGNLSLDLRLLKQKAALLIALADLGGVWEPGQVTHALSRLARHAIGSALEGLWQEMAERDALPDAASSLSPKECGLVILGMGKLGADELNYSSDIDLIVLFDETRYAEEDYAAVRSAFVKLTKRLVQTLSAQTEEGYVFRTDLRLRPNPAVTPVCMAMEPAERYYESLGRTWERAAMIKARPVGGDIAAGEDFLSRLGPFVWRRHLDFVAINDAQDMLLKIRDHKGLQDEITLPGHDLKLGRGGIREIEFFAQSNQLIFGGREPAVRARGTLDALGALAEAGRISTTVAEALSEAYTEHRQAEHRLQMIDDAQTHQVPADPERFERFACLSGHGDTDAFSRQMTERLEAVHRLTALEKTADGPQASPVSASTEALLGEYESGWMRMPVFRSERAQEIYKRFRSDFAASLGATADPAATLKNFDHFMSALPAGVQLFSLFEARPSLLDLLMDVASVSPHLAGYLGRNARVLDAVLEADFFAGFATASELAKDLAALLERETDFEAQLDAARRWQKENHFRAGVHLLRGVAGPDEIARAYSAIAEASLKALLPCVVANLSRKHGNPPGRGAAVVAMGKLGTQEMTAGSDLDLIVVYDAPGETQSEGPKPLAVPAYYSRLTQSLIAALTAPTSEGQLYEVDMRLRPSGRKGPVAVSLQAFGEYQREVAWTWETLALTRARVVAGSAGLCADLSKAIGEAVQMPRDGDVVRKDVREMLERLRQAKPGAAIGNGWEMKAGRGRLMEMELALQAGVVLSGLAPPLSAREALPRLVEAGWLTAKDAGRLSAALCDFSALQHVARLVGDGFDPDAGSTALAQIIERLTGAADLSVLKRRFRRRERISAALIDRLLADP